MKIPRKDIMPDPDQPRKTFNPEKLGELKDSMAGKGPDQPLIVRTIDGGKYMIVTGERRWRACEDEEIECIVRDVDNKAAREMQFKENVQREDVDPVEMGRAFWEYRKKYGVDQELLAKMIGVSSMSVSRHERLYTTANVTLRGLVQTGKLDVESGSQIARIEDKGKQRRTAQAAVDHELKQPEIRQVVKQVKAEPTRSVTSIVREVERRKAKARAAGSVAAAPQPERRVETERAPDREGVISQWYSQLEKSYSQPRGQVSSWPSGKYNTIYIDPPWPFEDRISPHMRGATAYYPCLSVKQIEDLDVGGLAMDDCLLWVWIPRLFRRWGEEVIESWGFIPKTEWIWGKTTIDGAKIRGGMGHYNRMAHEYLMLGTKGTARPLNGKKEVSVILAPREEHSKKPDVFYDLIERNSLEPRIELFARGERQDWSVWGDELAFPPRQEREGDELL